MFMHLSSRAKAAKSSRVFERSVSADQKNPGPFQGRDTPLPEAQGRSLRA
jgi:hypothetical protein